MSRSIVLSIFSLLALLFAISCSSGGTAVDPSTTDQTPVKDAAAATSILGFWQVVVDKDAGTIEAVDLRNSDLIVNVLGFLEPPALSGMTIDFGTLVIGTDTVNVDVILKHPIPDPVFMGFDVRGVVFGPEVTNADGLTIIPSPEFFLGVPFGYQDGLLGAPDSVGNYSGLAGYKYFCDGLGMNDNLVTFMSNPTNVAKRGVFKNATTLKRHYDLDWADVPQPLLVFNYAIYANYNWPTGAAPIDISDFDITTTNSAEAICAKVTETSNSLWASGGVGGGAISMNIEIWDWQGDIDNVSIKSLDGTWLVESFFDVFVGPGSTPYSWVYQFTNVPGTPTVPGDADILITVTDPKTFGEAWFLGLLPTGNSKYATPVYNCFKYTTTVIECPVPTVVSVDPSSGAGVIDDLKINCTNLINGASLGAKLTDGTNNWVGTDVQFVSGTQMTADFDLNTPAPTFGSYLDVVVTNGCSTEGQGLDLFQVLYTIKPIDPTNIQLKDGEHKDIACNPKEDRVAINDKTWWTGYMDNYSAYGGFPFWINMEAAYFDWQPWGTMYGSQYYASPGQYPVWCWMDWDGNDYPAYWMGDYYNGFRDFCNLQNTEEIWTIFDAHNSAYAVFMMSNGIMSYSEMYYGFSPWYDGSGTNGVLMKDILAIDMPPFEGTYQMYILEGGSTKAVEKWTLSDPPTYVLSFGSGTLNKPLDITVDSSGIVYVLDIKADNTPVIYAYDSSGALVGKTAAIDSSVIAGDALRLDAHNFMDPDEVHVLHTKGVTKFTMY